MHKLLCVLGPISSTFPTDCLDGDEQCPSVLSPLGVFFHSCLPTETQEPNTPCPLLTNVAGPIRFRYSPQSWFRDRVQRELYRPLNEKFGAQSTDPRYPPPPAFAAVHLSMDNGDLALFAWKRDESGAYWLGNTETPQTLWRTDKYTFEESPYPVARWAQRVLLAELADAEPWISPYRHVMWFFLPVLFSKDGKETSRAFFRDHAAGFPDATREQGLEFYEELLKPGILDAYRYTTATKLGTSDRLDLVRMRASMAELNAAKLLSDSGYSFTPEVELDSGYTLDFRLADSGQLIEVTRPEPPTRRRAGTAASAIKETVQGKTDNQLKAHQGAVVFVDCTSFRDDEWQAIRAESPSVGYRPAVVYRMRPEKPCEGYVLGQPGLSLALS